MEPGNSSARIPEELATTGRQLNPFDWYREQRSAAPVSYDESRETWDIFRYDDVARVLSDHTHFSSQLKSGSGVTMISADPPNHKRLRNFATSTFSPSAIAQRQDRIYQHARETLTQDVSGESIELMRDFAIPLSKYVMADILNIPDSDWDSFKHWSNAFVIAPDLEIEPTSDGFTDPEIVKWQMTSYLNDLLDERRRTQQEGLISSVSRADTLTRDEKLGFFDILLTAGYSPMVNLITNAVWCLADSGYMVAGDREEPKLQTVVEEVLRYRSPIQAMSRTAVSDVELKGHQIEAGDRVTAWIGSANRDSDIFDDPDVFEPSRDSSSHLAFGRGIHYCLGAPLARLQAREALRAVFTVYPDLTPTPTRTPLTSPFLHGLEALHCKLAAE